MAQIIIAEEVNQNIRRYQKFQSTDKAANIPNKPPKDNTALREFYRPESGKYEPKPEMKPIVAKEPEPQAISRFLGLKDK